MLDARKIRILEAIITDYIATAEPIGSRTIAKKYDLGISSATIRNEMSDLEEMGYITQPHASSGRIPSERGYRLYVDGLMGATRLSVEQEDFLLASISGGLERIDNLMGDVARAISILTNYTAVASEPQMARVGISHVQLVPVDEARLALVIVTSAKTVKNHMVSLNNPPPLSALNSISLVLTHFLANKGVADINKKLIAKIGAEFEKIGAAADILDAIIPAIIASLRQEQAVRLHTSGIKNILAFPEFSNLEKAREIFQMLEERETLATMLTGDEDIRIAIGSEINMPAMSDCSIIKARVRLGDGMVGHIAIIGPTRMDYSRGLSVINSILQKIERSNDFG